MSVEKIPNMAAHGASNAKNAGGAKGGHGAQGAGDGSDPKGAFGALLSSLAVDDVEPTGAISAAPEAFDDQPKGIASSEGNAFMAFSSIVQGTPLTVAEANVDNVALEWGQNNLVAVEDTLNADGAGLIAADTPSTAVLPGPKPGFRSPGQSDLSQMPDAIGLGNVGTKLVRLLKERGRAESAPAVTTVPIQPASAIDTSRLDMHVVGEKAEFLGRRIAVAAADVLPLEFGQQTEFRREKAIFKVNSTTTVTEFSATNGPNAKPANLSLEGMALDVGAGMTRGEQNPGTYWMSSDMKNAEMKLDGFGESPVEVSISVHGNQTHVAFRTDEAQTRLALEDAGTTLKDMLSKEGLNLAGVSVGISGAGGVGTQEHRSRQESRPKFIVNLVDKFPSGTSGHVVTSRVGQLDVFV